MAFTPVRSGLRLGRADRSRVGNQLAGVDPEGNDARGLYADDRVLEPLSEGLAPHRDHGSGPAHLDHAWLPWGEHVVDHDARPAGAPHVAKFLGLAHPQAAHVDSVMLLVVAKRRWHHVRLPVRADGRDPAQALPGEVAEFHVREHAHARLTGLLAAAFRRLPKDRPAAVSHLAGQQRQPTPPRLI